MSRVRGVAAASLACLLALQGCTLVAPQSTARRDAAHRVEPLFAAIDAYRKEHREYPPTLEALKASPHGRDLVLAVEGRALSIRYKRIDNVMYQVDWDNGLCWSRYVNAKPVASGCNAFR